MANVNAPNGFLFLTTRTGSLPPEVKGYYAQSTNSLAIFKQDLVYEIAGVSGFNAAPIKSFADGATVGTTVPLGVSINRCTQGVQTLMSIIVDEAAEYVAQDDGLEAGGLVATMIGKNANVDVATLQGGISPAPQDYSGMMIDDGAVTAAPGTSATAFEMHLLRLSPDVNNAFGVYARVVIKFMKNREGLNTVGV
jgi:hypothetical protein